MMQKKEGILLVEDEQDLADVLSFIFEDLGINVETALSYKEAIDKLENSQYQMVVTDMRLPDGTGAEICQQYSPTCPFIIYSGFSDISKQEALDLGALMILSKPLDLEKFGGLIKTFLDGEINEEQFLAKLA